MKFKLKDENIELTKSLTIAGIIIVLFCVLITHLNIVGSVLSKILSVCMPFLFGIAIGFVLHPLQKKIENDLLKKTKWHPGTKRKVSVTISIVLFFLIVILLFATLIPAIYESAVSLSQSIGGYVASAQKMIDELLADNPTLLAVADWIYDYGESMTTTLVTSVTNYLPTILNYSISFVVGLVNFFIGIIIAVYILLDREKFKAQFKKINYAIFPKDKADFLVRLSHLTSKTFNGFIIGKAIDSLIIGILCFIGMTIFRMDYAILISVIVGITNFIPVFGPFIGAIPSILLLLIINPIEAFWFAIFVLALQQFDGNILGPYILGDNMGLPTFWVLFAIIVGGGFFGIVGMILGVPVFAIIYVLVKEFTYKRLEQKNINLDTMNSK